MEMVSVVSTNVEQVGYDADTQVMAVRFKSGLYHYFDVPELVYQELLASESKGTYLAANIKGRYAFMKVG